MTRPYGLAKYHITEHCQSSRPNGVATITSVRNAFADGLATFPIDAQKASARIHAEAQFKKWVYRAVFMGSRLLPWGGFSGHRLGITGARWLRGKRFLGNQPHSMASFQGEERTTPRAAKRPQQPHLGIAAAVFPLTHNIHLPLSRRQKYDHT